jgi:endonuclease-3
MLPQVAMARRPSSSRAAKLSKASVVLARLSTAYPGATTELTYRNPFELLVATILSAQSTDARVNLVSPALFSRYPDAQALASADLADVERLVQPTGFFRVKARAIVSMSQHLVARHGGQVPASLDALVALPGVGRKTANVVLGHALDVPGLPVDRHVLRVATRLGLAIGPGAEEMEAELCELYPPRAWTLVSDCLILHGRRICRPKPLCASCMVSADCDFYRKATVGAALASRRAAAAVGRRKRS